ncbi:peptide MFS transporter [Exiguobacterium flavidum]|uniref:peptide MFS transporter n=1 Tax=Exiguobacterium flavidum TaxID=2184695 RepID=UPI000DF78537|nr:peptide MFS transporter [Exiguobacterium flavidum]
MAKQPPSFDREKVYETVPQTGFFGNPKGLFTLFFTEFWERFSYYGMRAILIYYMYYSVSEGGLGFEKSTAASIMAVYGSLVYMSGILGGWIADRLLGTSRTVFYGGILIMFGHIVLALPGGATALFISMGLIIIGTGLLKPNVSNIVGDLYSRTDGRRDAGFSIFYMGINMGAFLSPLIVGKVSEGGNFHLGFGLAAIGMFLGLLVFVLTKKKNLGQAGAYVPNPLLPEERKKVLGRIAIGVVVVAALAFVSASIGILTLNSFTFLVSILGILLPIAYFVVMYKSPKVTEDEKSRLLAYIPLFIAAMIFWAIQEQGAYVLSIFADEQTRLSLLGWELKAAYFQSVNPLFIIALAPVFASFWVRLGDHQPTTTRKFSFGLIFAGLSFIVMMFPGLLYGTDTLVSPMWLVASFFLVVIGELFLSPVGLSATTKLAPAAFSAQTMSLWFLTNASAQAINAQIVKFYNDANQVMYFGVIGAVAIFFGLVLYLIAPRMQKYMRGVR